MRFSPHRTIPDNSLEEIEVGYDSLSEDSDDDYYPSSSPLVSSVLSSPLKSTLNTPSKSPKTGKTRKIRNTYRAFHSSPLASSPFSRQETSPSKLFSHTQLDSEDDLEYAEEQGNTIEDDLSALLQDLDFKERYLLIQQNTKRRTTLRHYNHQGLNNSSRPSSKNSHSISSSVIAQEDVDDALYKQVEKLKLQEIQDSVINSLESRLSKRSKDVETRVKQIEDHKRKLEEERKRQEEEKKRQEEEKKRLEEERILKEEQEKIRLEKEARKLKELEQQKLEEAKVEQEKVQRLKAEQALKSKEEAEKLAKEKKEKEAKKGNGVTNFEQVEKLFLQYKSTISTIKTDVVDKVKSDLATKKLIMAHKRKINPKFGQLTNSLTQLSKISQELTHLIGETKASDIAFKWILNFVAKAIVSQAETEVRAKPSSSVPLAKLTLNLLCEFPELKEYLMARFVKKCPFVIGYTTDITTETGRLLMGWKRHDDDKWEDSTTYDERVGGIMTLYSVLSRLKLDQKYYSTTVHPIPISNSWVVLARIVNTPKNLITNTHFIILSSWWEACAFELLSTYGKQATKLLSLVWIDFTQLVQEQKLPGANTLKAIGEDWAQSGQIKRFDEMES